MLMTVWSRGETAGDYSTAGVQTDVAFQAQIEHSGAGRSIAEARLSARFKVY